MTLWTIEHRVFAYDSFVKNNESVTAVQHEFRRHFKIHRNDSVPARNTILRWVKSLRTRGTIQNARPVGAPRTVRSRENVKRVRQALLRSPRRSARRHSTELGISARSVRRILHEDLHFHPYKVVISQQLKPTDHEQRLNFARQMKTIFEANDNLTLLMSDEAHFHLNGMVNTQNFRYWATENPREIHERPLHSPKVTVWCAMGKTAIIGPYFFEDNHGNAVTVNSERYIEMINSFFVPALRRRHMTIQHVWFQQDGATAHTARASMAVLRPLFKDHLISRFADTPWPPRSPDLSMCDYFLWGHLKACVYVHRPRTLDELQNAVRVEVAQIDRAMLERVEANFHQRLQKCIDENGHHMRDVVFHT